MDLKVGNLMVPAVFVGSTPVAAVYVGSKLVWSATVQITLGPGYEARDQFRAALTERGLDYQTVTEVPFRIELVGSGSIQEMFRHCSALRTAPAMDTSNVTSMMRLFHSCYALTSVPDMNTSQVTDMSFTFYYCQSLTDGNVRLMGKNPNVYTSNMIVGSSLTREPWYTTGGAPIDVHQVSLTDVLGIGGVHPLLAVTVPAGETWNVRIQGTVTRAASSSLYHPTFRIGTAESGQYAQGSAVDFSGAVTSDNGTIALLTRSGSSSRAVSFTGTVTIEQVVQINLGTDYEARDQLRAALSARGLDYQTVTEIPFEIELVGSGSARDMFRACYALTTVPAMDTSSVTNMRNMFYDCSSLAHVPDMDTSQVTDMGHMFRNCSSLTYVPDLSTSSVTDMYAMFYNCSSLTDGNVRLIGRHPSVNTDFMIGGSGLTREPFYDAAGNPI